MGVHFRPRHAAPAAILLLVAGCVEPEPMQEWSHIDRSVGSAEPVSATVHLLGGDVRHLSMRRTPVLVKVWPKDGLSPKGLELMREKAVICEQGDVSDLTERQEGDAWIFTYDCLETENP